jgi:hypothetical protein
MLVCKMSVIQILSFYHGRWWWPKGKSELKELSKGMVTSILPLTGLHSKNIFCRNEKPKCFRILFSSWAVT